MSEDVTSISDNIGATREESADRGNDRASHRSYARGTPLDRGQRVHELFPSRYVTIGLVAFAALVFAAVLAIAHVWRQSLSDTLGLDASRTTALDLSASGSASRWFAAMLLSLATLVSAFIYSLRRHRLDDYNGRYRIWLWTAGACLLASLVETTSVGSIGRGLCGRLATACGLDDSVVWSAAVAIPLAALAVRLLIEVRRCRLSTAVLVLAAAGLALAAAAGLGLVEAADVDAAPLVQRVAWLTGYVFMLSSFLLYSRHVMREIAGLIPAPAPKIRRRKKNRVAARPDSETEDDSQQKHPAARTDLEPVKRTVPASESYSARHETLRIDSQHEQGLSKAERRRLRREARRSA